MTYSSVSQASSNLNVYLNQHPGSSGETISYENRALAQDTLRELAQDLGLEQDLGNMSEAEWGEIFEELAAAAADGQISSSERSKLSDEMRAAAASSDDTATADAGDTETVQSGSLSARSTGEGQLEMQLGSEWTATVDESKSSVEFVNTKTGETKTLELNEDPHVYLDGEFMGDVMQDLKIDLRNSDGSEVHVALNMSDVNGNPLGSNADGKAAYISSITAYDDHGNGLQVDGVMQNDNDGAVRVREIDGAELEQLERESENIELQVEFDGKNLYQEDDENTAASGDALDWNRIFDDGRLDSNDLDQKD